MHFRTPASAGMTSVHFNYETMNQALKIGSTPQAGWFARTTDAKIHFLGHGHSRTSAQAGRPVLR